MLLDLADCMPIDVRDCIYMKAYASTISACDNLVVDASLSRVSPYGSDHRSLNSRVRLTWPRDFRHMGHHVMNDIRR